MLFVTMIAGIIDVEKGELQLCQAGHDAPILLRPNKPPQQLALEGGPPLCVMETFEYQVANINLQSGDMLVLISDGITEAQDSGKALFGIGNIVGYLNTVATDGYDAEAVCRGLYKNVKQFTKETNQSDDITIMTLKFDPR